MHIDINRSCGLESEKRNGGGLLQTIFRSLMASTVRTRLQLPLRPRAGSLVTQDLHRRQASYENERGSPPVQKPSVLQSRCQNGMFAELNHSKSGTVYAELHPPRLRLLTLLTARGRCERFSITLTLVSLSLGRTNTSKLPRNSPLLPARLGKLSSKLWTGGSEDFVTRGKHNVRWGLFMPAGSAVGS